MAEIVMPRLSDTMEEGTILRWLKRDGEHVSRGEELVEIETDKANMTYESDQEGVLEILAAEGDTLAVGAPIAHVGEGANGAAAERQAAVDAPVPADGTPPTTVPPTTISPTTVPPTTISPTTVPPTTITPVSLPPTAAAAAEPPPSARAPDGARIKASPLARRIAGERGVDLRGLNGSGPGGRIVKADVEAAPASAPTTTAAPTPTPIATATPASTPPPGAAPPAIEPAIPASPASIEGVAVAKGETSIQELSRTQRTIARRMAESKATIPDFTLNMDVDMEECVTLRKQLKQLARDGVPAHPVPAHPEAAHPEAAHPEAAHPAPTYNDMVVKASALALREFPRANGSYRDGSFELHARVNVGVAVATEDALVVPTVFDADAKSLGEIARETRALAERVRAATITPPELGGGTFTVSNLGMFGVKSFTAIVNPPQAAILSVGLLEARPVVRGGELLARHTLSLTLACDHRILYGADAANFLARVRELLEQPASLTL